jgi:hypothetical protein
MTIIRKQDTNGTKSLLETGELGFDNQGSDQGRVYVGNGSINVPLAKKSEIDNLTKSDIGLSNVDNTSDANKPVSTAQQDALDLKVAIADIVNNLTSTSTTQPLSAAQGKALKDLIDNINAVLQSDDATLDELQEIVDFIKLNRSDLDTLGISSIAGLQNALDGKVDKISGKGLSTEDYTTAEKNKLAGIAAGAQVNTVTSVAGKTGAVTLAKSDVGLGNVDNTTDSAKSVLEATRFTTARTINGTSFNGTANITTSNWGTARTINGTSVNGSANVTTANWGTARTLTVGATGKSVNGSGNVAWTLAEIGAADRNLTLTGGDGVNTIGNLTANRTISVDATVVRTSGDQTINGVKTFGSAPLSTNGYTTGSATMVYNATSKSLDFNFA